ncbi:unnamed protein product [Paramecium octaurelia]|uniref:Uncharacterized protein n=1 Tax=Paramecium octaurelia TaxID=43137 RepID=A0A8S1WQT3_PAROT|nr:unnamed protein product [Paramecium octaurelia]
MSKREFFSRIICYFLKLKCIVQLNKLVSSKNQYKQKSNMEEKIEPTICLQNSYLNQADLGCR